MPKRERGVRKPALTFKVDPEMYVYVKGREESEKRSLTDVCNELMVLGRGIRFGLGSSWSTVVKESIDRNLSIAETVISLLREGMECLGRGAEFPDHAKRQAEVQSELRAAIKEARARGSKK